MNTTLVFIFANEKKTTPGSNLQLHDWELNGLPIEIIGLIIYFIFGLFIYESKSVSHRQIFFPRVINARVIKIVITKG